MKCLFITWDGPGQNYLESLFAPILSRLADMGYAFHVLQFRWGAESSKTRAKHATLRSGLEYTSVRILREPRLLGTAVTLLRGSNMIRRYVRKHDIDVVMPRSILPAAMAMMALKGLAPLKPRFIFDADGLPADERVDFSGWRPTGVMYRLFRDAEAQAVRRADAVITRTARARSTLECRAGAGSSPRKFHVIPNGRDISLFAPLDDEAIKETRAELGVCEDTPLVVYVGSLGPKYNPDLMLRLFTFIHSRNERARLLILTGHRERARLALEKSNAPAHAITIDRVSFRDVPRFIGAANAGIALIAPAWSTRAVSPIKIGEYLLCGVPVMSIRGVGDLDEQIDERVGYLLDGTEQSELEAAADWFLRACSHRDEYRERCRRRGVEEFSLDTCIERYSEALRPALLP